MRTDRHCPAKGGDSGNGAKWRYLYSALPGDVDLMADTEKVADYWESLGTTVRLNANQSIGAESIG